MNHAQGRFDDALDQLEVALAVTRDLGNAPIQCAVLSILGMVYDSWPGSARPGTPCGAALLIARNLGDRRSEGSSLGYLGLLHAHQANFDEARRCLDAGYVLLHAVSDQLNLGILLCNRAEAEHVAGVPNAERTALAEADAIAAEFGAGPGSELGRAITWVRNLTVQDDVSGSKDPKTG